MRDWRELTLGDLATWTSGKLLPATDRTPSGAYPLHGANGVIGRTNRILFRDPVVTVGRVGAIGEVHVTSGPVWVSDNALVAQPRPLVLTAFLALLLEAFDFQKIRGGTTQPLITQRALSRQAVMLAPLTEQRRIIDLIGAVETTSVRSREAEAAARQAYSAVLEGAARATGQLLTVRECVEVAKAGGTPSRAEASFFGGGIPWLKSGEVAQNLISQTEETLTESGLRSSSAWLVPAGAIVLAMYGATAGAVGRTAIPLATNQAVLSLVARPGVIEQGLLFHMLRWLSPNLKAQAVGAAQPNLSKERVLEAAIPVPPESEQSSLTALLDDLLEFEASCSEASWHASVLRAALLADLLSGDHEIPASYDRFLDGAA